MKGPVFVAGATGYTGRAVVARCVELGLPVWAHVRPDSERLRTWETRFATMGAQVDSTPWEPAALQARFQQLQPALVFALLGTTQARARRTGLRNPYDTVDYGMTAMLIDAAAACTPRPRLVYLSALGTSPRSLGAYLRTRWRTEEYLRASGLPMCIARPALIAGDREEHRPAEALAEPLTQLLTGALHILGAKRLAARYSTISGVGLAKALVSLGTDPVAVGTVCEGEGLQARARA